MVGYTNGCVPNIAGDAALRTQPLYGFLHHDTCPDDPQDRACPRLDDDASTGVPVGRFDIEDTPHRPRGFRMRLRFTLPDDLVPDTYYVLLCEDPCVTGLVYGMPHPIFVGVDPGSGPVRGWPLDDPAIDILADDALVLGPDGDPMTAAEIRGLPPSERVGLSEQARETAESEQSDLGEDDVAIADDATAGDETGATGGSGDEDGGSDGGGGLGVVALAIGAVVLALWVALTRMGGGRKQIRHGPPRL